MRRRTWLGAALAMPAIPPAWAQDRVVRVIVPFPPAGAIDAIARLLAPEMAARLRETWVIENRAGGNGVIGAEAVMRAAPDGRTLMFSADIHLVVRAVMRSVPYDPVADFTPLARVAQGPMLLVGHPGLPAQDLPGLIAVLRARPGALAFANTALGAMGHVTTESFKQRLEIDALTVTYRGTAQALNDVVGGQAGLMMAPLLSGLPLVRAGRLRGFAVTAPARSPAAPEIPTMAEGGLADFNFTVWYGLWAPRGMPEPQADRLNTLAREVAAEPGFASRLAELGNEPVRESRAQFAAHIAAEHARNSAILARAGVQPE
jgi:tripartite-type tricarboxylate transporter receptor subunit TctC